MKTFKRILGRNILINCLVNTADVSDTEDIFFSDKVNLHRNTINTNTCKVKFMHVNLPMELIAKYQSSILSAGYIFVNGIPLFSTYSRDIKFISSQQQDIQTDLTMQAMNSIKAYYANRGFNIV